MGNQKRKCLFLLCAKGSFIIIHISRAHDNETSAAAASRPLVDELRGGKRAEKAYVKT